MSGRTGCTRPCRNLLLPKGMPVERPWARFRVRVYRAEGLPTMGAGLMASLSKVMDRTVFIDPYVHVSFSGQQVRTNTHAHGQCRSDRYDHRLIIRHYKTFSQTLSFALHIGGDIGGQLHQQPGVERADLLHRALPPAGSTNQSADPR